METVQKGLRREEFKRSYLQQICRPLEIFNPLHRDNVAHLRSLQPLPTKQQQDQKESTAVNKRNYIASVMKRDTCRKQNYNGNL